MSCINDNPHANYTCVVFTHVWHQLPNWWAVANIQHSLKCCWACAYDNQFNVLHTLQHSTASFGRGLNSKPKTVERRSDWLLSLASTRMVVKGIGRSIRIGTMAGPRANMNAHTELPVFSLANTGNGPSWLAYCIIEGMRVYENGSGSQVIAT